MSSGFYHTVTRRTPLGWVAIRMCEQEEICRVTAKTQKEALAKLVIECLNPRLQSNFTKNALIRNSEKNC